MPDEVREEITKAVQNGYVQDGVRTLPTASGNCYCSVLWRGSEHRIIVWDGSFPILPKQQIQNDKLRDFAVHARRQERKALQERAYRYISQPPCVLGGIFLIVLGVVGVAQGIEGAGVMLSIYGLLALVAGIALVTWAPAHFARRILERTWGESEIAGGVESLAARILYTPAPHVE